MLWRSARGQVGLLAWLYGSAKRRGPFLVVAPLSTIPNWLREVRNPVPPSLPPSLPPFLPPSLPAPLRHSCTPSFRFPVCTPG